MIPAVTLVTVEIGPRPELGLRRENFGTTGQRFDAIAARILLALVLSSTNRYPIRR